MDDEPDNSWGSWAHCIFAQLETLDRWVRDLRDENKVLWDEIAVLKERVETYEKSRIAEDGKQKIQVVSIKKDVKAIAKSTSGKWGALSGSGGAMAVETILIIVRYLFGR